MPRDRRVVARFLILVVGTLAPALSTGCARTPMLRPGDFGPTPSASPSGNERNPFNPADGTPKVSQIKIDNNVKTADNEPSIGSSGATSGTPSSSAGTPEPPDKLSAQGVDSAEPPLRSPASEGTISTPAGGKAPSGPATPLLDAAIERVAAIRAAQDEAEPEPIEATPEPVPAKSIVREAPAPAPVPAPPPAVDAEPQLPPISRDPVPAAIPSLIAVPTEKPAAPEASPAPNQSGDVPAASVVNQETATASAPASASRPVSEQTPHDTTPPRDASAPNSGDRPPLSTPAPSAAENPLAIGGVRFCRRVHGFGSFEPVTGSALRAGQRTLVYCEIIGMQYEQRDASYVSRLVSKLEIVSARDGSVAWVRDLGPVEDVCASRRRDFYVNYRVDLAKTLAPGAYTLRLTQTDLNAHRTTSAELPFEIIP